MAGYYFSLPLITQLTISQQAALYETRPIALSGGPGTGKSVVSLWRHISNYRNHKKSLLLTYTTTLAKYLSTCCTIQDKDAAMNIGRSCKDKKRIDEDCWNEIIIDEAQDLPLNYYNELSTKVSYGADDSQILYPENSSSLKQLKELFPENADYILDKNFRSTQKIMQFAKVAFPDAYIPRAIIDGLSNNIGELPIMLITGRNEWNEEIGKFNLSNWKQNDAIINIINTFRSDTHNIAILVPFKADVQIFESILESNDITDFSVYYEDRDGRFPDGCEIIKNIHITTFKSAKGLEFDTVIIPNFQKSKEIQGRFNTEWEDYYVGVTRARSNLYLISNYDIPEYNLVTDKSIV